MAIEIVDFPMKKMVIFYSYVSLPEGTTYTLQSSSVTIENSLFQKFDDCPMKTPPFLISHCPLITWSGIAACGKPKPKNHVRLNQQFYRGYDGDAIKT